MHITIYNHSFDISNLLIFKQQYSWQLNSLESSKDNMKEGSHWPPEPI